MPLAKSRIEKIMGEAIATHQLVKIRYQKAWKEETVDRVIEPYEVKTEQRVDGTSMTYVYGHDVTETIAPTKKHIKRWCTGRFFKAEKLDETFEPRY